MSYIDNSSVLYAISNITNYIANCFDKCRAKGSTFSGTEKLNNLESAIDLIPQSSGGGVSSDSVTGASFSGFGVTKPDEPYADEFTIDFGSVGVTWKSIVCYSDTKDGHFSIQKITNGKCIISSAVFYNAENVWEEAHGIYPNGRGTYRATYSISGNSITFTNAEYDATSNGFNNYDEFSKLPNQVSNDINDYFTDQYKLDKITVLV